MQNYYIIRYGEINLKGKNRIDFEKRLVENIRDCLRKNSIKDFRIKRVRNRILVDSEEDCKCLKRVFGITSFSKAVKTNLEEIKKICLNFIKNKKFKSFRITTKKLQDSIKVGSMELNKEIGAFVQEKTKARVDLNNFEYNLQIELFENSAWIFDKKIRGFGGLPVGVSGRVICLVEKEEDLLAVWLMMKRGGRVYLTGKKIDFGFLEKFDYGQKLEFFKDLEKGIKEKGCKAVVSGQTLEDFEDLGLNILTLRPLIGFNKKEVKDKIKEIENEI